jgi:hypothetical protein
MKIASAAGDDRLVFDFAKPPEHSLSSETGLSRMPNAIGPNLETTRSQRRAEKYEPENH